MQRIVVDACFLLNLLATGREVEIVRALSVLLFIAPQARAETVYLAGPPETHDEESRPTREPVDLSGLERHGCLHVEALDATATELHIQCAEHLRDADAACLALAASMNVPLASDDGRVRKIAARLFPKLELIATLQVVRRASSSMQIEPEDLRMLLRRLRVRGNFAPPRKDPDREWYESFLDDE